MKQKVIWFLWMQGKDKMPPVVKMCYESWEMWNKDYEIVFLDYETVKQYVSIDDRIWNNKNITIQALSDIIRVNLLAEKGGIWVDATCYCMKPLNEWLDEYLVSGFFAFDKPWTDRMIASWFLVINKENYLSKSYADEVNRFWLGNSRVISTKKHKLSTLLNSWIFLKFMSFFSMLWFKSIFLRRMKVYPYFIFHYLFEYIYRKDEKFREIWDKTPKYSADIPHRIFFHGYTSVISKKIIEEIDARVAPFYKLSHKVNYDWESQNTVLGYLYSYHAKLKKLS